MPVYVVHKKLATGLTSRLLGDGKCEIEIKNKNASIAFSLFLNELPYGGACTYKVKTKCGYPQFSVNNSNIDMVVAYKKEKWDDPTYEPLDDDSYSDDETYNPTFKNGKIIFTLDKSAKNDDANEKNETKCKDTQIYLTLTNKLNPLKPTSTLSQDRLGSALTQVSDAGDQKIALFYATSVDVSQSVFMTLSYIFSLAILSSFILFLSD